MQNNTDYLLAKFSQDDESVRLLAKYFDKNNIQLSARKLNEKDLEVIFASLVKDYLEYRIDPDTLGYLCGKIVYCLIQDDKYLCNTHIGGLLSRIGDWDIDLRHNPESVGEVLQTILDEYKRIK